MELGDLATWVSGVGSIAVGSAALAISIGVRRHEKETAEQSFFRGCVIALRQLQKISDACAKGANAITSDFNGDTKGEYFRETANRKIFLLNSDLLREVALTGQFRGDLGLRLAKVVGDVDVLSDKVTTLLSMKGDSNLLKPASERKDDKDNYTGIGLRYSDARRDMNRAKDLADRLANDVRIALQEKRHHERQVLAVALFGKWRVEVFKVMALPPDHHFDLDGD